MDVLLVTNGNAEAASNALGPRGRRHSRTGSTAGGRYVGWRGGAEVAARLGLTSAQLAAPKSDVAGALLRSRTAAAAARSPPGSAPFAWVFYDYDLVMRPSSPDHVAFAYPPADDGDFFVSGFACGEEELGGTAAVVDEPLGAGRVVLFASDPELPGVDGRDAEGASERRSRPGPGRRDGRNVLAAWERGEVRGSVAGSRLAASADRHGRVGRGGESVLQDFGASFSVKTAGGKARFLIENPGDLSGEEHPYAGLLPQELERAGVEVVAFRAP